MEWIPEDRIRSAGSVTGPVICTGTSKQDCTGPETDAMTKKEARQYFRSKRAEISAAQMEKWKDLMLIHFQQVELPFLSTVHSFLPIEEKKEPDPKLKKEFEELEKLEEELKNLKKQITSELDAEISEEWWKNCFGTPC